MTAGLRLIAADPALRLAILLILLFGGFIAAAAPYASILAVQVFGLGDGGFAAMLVVSSVLSVAAALGFGIMADQRANRRGIAALCAALNLAGSLLMLALPSPAALVLTHALLLPAGGALFGQLFAMARLAAAGRPTAERDTILAAARAAFALPWIIVLPALAAAIRAGMPVTAIYAILTPLAALTLALIVAFWPRDGRAAWADRPSGLNFRAALAEIARAPIALRVALVGVISCGSTINMALVGLILTGSGGRGEGDVALFVGLYAGLEVPFMLATPLMLRHIDRSLLIALGAVLFALHLTLLAPLAPTPFVWALIVPAAAGGVIYLSVMIGYLQDLMADRPGTGSALIAVQKVAGDLVAAAAFIIGTTLSGYGLAAVLAATAAVAAGLVLWRIDRPRAQRQSKNPGPA